MGNYGVGCVIELNTGLLIDYHVLSKNCHTCALAKSDLGEDSPEYDIWFSGHKPDCDKNYSGPSGARKVSKVQLQIHNAVVGRKFQGLSHLQSLNIYGDKIIQNLYYIRCSRPTGSKNSKKKKDLHMELVNFSCRK